MFKKILLLAIFIFSFSTVHALELNMDKLVTNIYGELFIGASYTHNDRTMLLNNDQVGTDNYDTLDLTLGDFSKVGLSLNFYNVTAIIEVQVNYAEIIRRFLVQYEFNNGALVTVGKDWTPVGYSYDQNANNQQGLWDYGVLWDQRQPQIKFAMHGLELAAIYPDIDFALTRMDLGTETVDTIKSAQFIPRFEAAYTLEAGSFSGKIFAGYSRYTAQAQYEAAETEAVVREISFDNYLIGIGFEYLIADIVAISATGFYGENLELTGQLQYMNGKLTSLLPSYNNITNKTTSIQSAGGAIHLSVYILENLSAIGGAGYTSSSNTSFKSGSNDDHFTAYVNMPITLSKYFILTPEVSYFNEMTDINGAYQGNAVYYGVYLLAQF